MFDVYWKKINNSLLDYETMKTLYNELKLCENIEGSSAEIGVFEGTTSKFIIDILQKPHYCYDTFEGIIQYSPENGDHHCNGTFSCSLDIVKNKINKENVFFKKGLFPDTFNENEIEFSFVYSDTATYFGAKHTFECFKNIIVSGGKIVFYFDDNCKGVKKFINELSSNLNFDISETKNLIIFTKKNIIQIT